MTKCLLIFIMALMLSATATGRASYMEPLCGIEVEEVGVLVEDTNVVVRGAAGQTLEVVSLTGRLITKVAIKSSSQTISLGSLPKGCYILKVGTVVRKIAIR